VLTSLRPLGETEIEPRLTSRRGGLMDFDIDLVKVRPRSFPLVCCVVLDAERLLPGARVRDGERDLEYEEPVYDE